MNELSAAEFTSDQTHGFVGLKSSSVTKSSAGLGWSAAHLSVQSEVPYAKAFEARADILIASANTGPVLVDVKTRDGCQRVLGSAGSVTIMPDRTAFAVDLQTPIESTHLYLRRSILDEVAGGLYRGDPADIDLTFRLAIVDPVLCQLCHAVREALDGDPMTSGLYVDHMMRAIAAYLLLRHSDADKRGKPACPNLTLSATQLARARETIEARLAERLTLTDLSADMGMSEDHFGRLFKRATGMPAHQFVIRCRVDRARRLLAETATPIAEIAFECGFADQVHLTRSFRRIVGTTPAAFRKAMQW